HQAPLGTSETRALDEPRSQGISTSSVRGPSDIKALVRTSGRQQLGTFISSVVLLADFGRSLDDLPPSTHRRPWPLIGIGPPPTSVPRPPPRQSDSWGMVPGLSTSQGHRSISLTA